MRVISMATVVCALMCVLGQTAPVWASSITISGVLEPASQGEAITGSDFHWRVEFHSAQEGGYYIDFAQGTVDIDENIFAIELAPTNLVLAQPEVWYNLAIDTDRDGLDENDWFEGRFRMAAVPFSLMGKPASFFATSGGHAPDRTFTPGAANGHLFVCPFHTPPSGVSFTKMSAYFEPGAGTSYSFGIYNATGEVVVKSGVITAWGLVTVNLEDFLEPSTTYYTAWGRTGGVGIRRPMIPDVPNLGTVAGVVVGAQIPDAFDPDTIVWTHDPPVISITLSR